MFDDLNEALFAQMAKLQSVDPKDKDKMEQVIEQSKAVSQLAGNIIGNANTAINLARFQASEGIGAAGLIATQPKMLGGGKRKLVVPVDELEEDEPEEDGEALEWLAKNAPDHTVSYLADRLGWTRDRVVSALDKLGIAAKSLDVKKRSWTEVERDKRAKAGL